MTDEYGGSLLHARMVPPQIDALYREHADLVQRMFDDPGAFVEMDRLNIVRAALHRWQEAKASGDVSAYWPTWDIGIPELAGR